MRAIDADALQKQFDEKCIKDCEFCPFYLRWVSEELEEEGCCVLIQKAPTIDPVKRAKWAFPEGGITGCVVCSNCQVFPISKNGRWVLSKYCPDCGAKMEE